MCDQFWSDHLVEWPVYDMMEEENGKYDASVFMDSSWNLIRALGT